MVLSWLLCLNTVWRVVDTSFKCEFPSSCCWSFEREGTPVESKGFGKEIGGSGRGNRGAGGWGRRSKFVECVGNLGIHRGN